MHSLQRTHPCWRDSPKLPLHGRLPHLALSRFRSTYGGGEVRLQSPWVGTPTTCSFRIDLRSFCDAPEKHLWLGGRGLSLWRGRPARRGRGPPRKVVEWDFSLQPCKVSGDALRLAKRWPFIARCEEFMPDYWKRFACSSQQGYSICCQFSRLRVAVRRAWLLRPSIIPSRAPKRVANFCLLSLCSLKRV